MKYKEIVDDIQVQFKSHNESISTQNPNWILFRFITELSALMDELIRQGVEPWMLKVTDPILPTLTTSANLNGFVDSVPFGLILAPEDSSKTVPNDGITNILPVAKQKKIHLESIDSVMRRIRCRDEMFSLYHYGFTLDHKIFIHPFPGPIQIEYVRTVSAINWESIQTDTEIDLPERIIGEARQRVVDSVILQKKVAQDEVQDFTDTSGVAGAAGRGQREQ